MNCQVPYLNSKDNLTAYLFDLGAISETNQILDLNLFREVTKQIEQEINLAYGVQGNPFLENDLTGSKTFYTNDKIFERIDEVRKQLGLYENKTSGSYQPKLIETSVQTLHIEDIRPKEITPELYKTLVDFTKKLNPDFRVEVIDDLFESRGVDGLINFKNFLIQLNQGKESKLVEEVSHLFFELMEDDNPLKIKMLDEITRTKIYKQVRNDPEYNRRYKGNVNLLKREVVAKLLSLYLVDKKLAKEMSGSDSLWENIQRWIKDFFKWIQGKQKSFSSFIESAERIVNLDTGGLNIDRAYVLDEMYSIREFVEKTKILESINNQDVSNKDRLYFNLNDTLFDYKGYPGDTNEKKKFLFDERLSDQRDQYYQTVKLTSLGRELTDKLQFINPERVTIYTQMVITPALETRLRNEFGNIRIERINISEQIEDEFGQIVSERETNSLQEVLDRDNERRILIVDNGRPTLTKPYNIVQYNARKSTYTNLETQLNNKRQREQRIEITDKFLDELERVNQRKDGSVTKQIMDTFNLIQSELADIKKTERYLESLGEEEVSKLFRDQYGNLGLPMKPIEAAKKLIEETNKYRDGLLQFYATLEGTIGFFKERNDNGYQVTKDLIESGNDEDIEKAIYELSKITKIGTAWQENIKQFRELIKDVPDTDTVDSLLGELETQISKTKSIAHDLNIKVLSSKLSNQFEAYNWAKRARKEEVEQKIQESTNPEEIKRYQQELDSLDEKGPDEISRILMGEVPDISSLTVWIKTLPNSQDPVVGTIGKLLQRAFAQVETKEAQRAQDMGAALEQVKKEHSLTDKDLEEILVVEKTPVYNIETEQDELRDRWAYLNPWQNRHEYDEKKKPFLDAYKKFIDAKQNKDPNLEQVRKDYLEQKRTFEDWETTNWYRPYTEEYYRRYDTLRNENPELFETLKVEQDLIWSEINSKSLLLKAETNSSQKKVLREELSNLRRKLSELKSEVYFDGSSKTGLDLDLAKLAQRKSEIDNQVHEWSVDFKFFEQDFTIYLNTLGIEDSQKDTYLALLAEGSNQSYSKLYQQIKTDGNQELIEWMDFNTIVRYSEQWYENRKRITDEISELSNKLSELYGQTSIDLKETWDSLLNISSPYRDEDRILEGSVTPTEVQERILEYEKKIEQIKQLTQQERQGVYSPEIKALKAQLGQKIQELKEVQNKETTESYNDTFVELANNSGITEEFNRLYPNLYFNYNSNLSLLINSAEFQDYLKTKEKENLFVQWYYRNHLTKSYTDSLGVVHENEVPTYLWYKIEPTDSKDILTLPSYQYSQRVVKSGEDGFVTMKEDWVTWNPLTYRWLPKSELYFNPAYRKLQQAQDNRSKGLYKALRLLTDYHLKTQENAPSEARLEFGIPYIQKRGLEASGSRLKNMFNEFIDRDNRFEEGEGNFDETIVNEPKGLKSRFISMWNSIWGNPEKDTQSPDNVRKYTRVAVPYAHYVELDRVSKDLVLTTTMFGFSTNKATRMLHTLPTFKLLEDVLQNTKLTRDEKGRPVSNNTNRLKAIQFAQSHFIYGVNKQYEIPGQMGKNIDRGLTIMRKINTIGSLGWPFGIANTLKNNLQGRLQNIIGRRFGDWSSPKSMRQASLNLNTNFFKYLSEAESSPDKRSLDYQIITFFNPSDERNLALTLHKGGSRRMIEEKHIMIMNQSMEFAINVNLLYGHLHHVKVKKGDEIKTLYDILKKDGNTIRAEEGWVEYKTGREIDDNYLIDTRLANQTVTEYVQGKVADKTLLATYTIGQSVLYFKNWLIPMLRRRFDSKKANYMIGEDIEGYWRTFGRLSYLMLRDLTNHGKTYWHTFTPEERRNYLTTLNEIVFVVVSSMLIGLVFGFDANDPDKFKKLKDNSYAENLALLVAIQAKAETEMLSLMPFFNVESQVIPPVLTELPKIIMNPTIGFSIITDAIKTVNATYGLVMDNDSAYYDKNMPAYNIEKGDPKATHYLMKTFQVDNFLYNKDNPEGKLQTVIGMMKR